MTIIKSIMYVNFEEPRSRDRDLGTLKLRKNCYFCLENLLICFCYKFADRGTLKFEHNLGANRDYAHQVWRRPVT